MSNNKTEDKFCRYCEAKLEKRPDERNDSWEVREHCDRFCSAKSIAERRKKHTIKKSAFIPSYF